METNPDVIELLILHYGPNWKNRERFRDLSKKEISRLKMARFIDQYEEIRNKRPEK